MAHEEPNDAVDALTLAVTDTPVPEGARDDERFMAEHAAAVADVALLREQLRIVGDALARRTEAARPPVSAATPDVGPPAPKPHRRPGPAPAPPPAPEPGPPSRTASAGLPPAVPFRPPGAARRRAVLALAAVLGAVLLGGAVWLGVDSGGDTINGADTAKSEPSATDDRAGGPADEGHGGQEDSDAGDAKQSPEGYVACARLIVEGTVRSVEPLPGGTQDRVTLDVSRHYKPAEGKPRITFPMDVDVDPRLRAGDRALIGITEGRATPDIWSTGTRLAADRRWIEKALPGARGREC